MNRTTQQTRAQRIAIGMAASSGSLAVAFPAARDLGPVPVLMMLAAAAAIAAMFFLVRRALKGGVAMRADESSCVAETLASL